MARRINAKLVMELLGMGMSARETSRTRGIASASVKKVRGAAQTRSLLPPTGDAQTHRISKTDDCFPRKRSVILLGNRL